MPRTAVFFSISILAAVAACLAGVPSAAADESPAALLARARDAAGGKAWDGIATSHQRAKLLVTDVSIALSCEEAAKLLNESRFGVCCVI